VAGLVVFTWGAYVRGRRAGPDEATDMVNAAHELDEELDNVKPSSWPKSVLMVLIGLGMLILGSEQLVNGATDIAKMLGVSDAVIGLTLVALGTSLPELSLSVIAAFRKQSDIAIGNVLGSNIFNVLGVLGLTSLVAPVPLPVSPEIWQRDIWVMIGVSLACLPIVAAGTRVSRAEGLVLLGLYGVYLGVLVVQSLGAAPQSPA
jgi:cation:H+ antiporter